MTNTQSNPRSLIQRSRRLRRNAYLFLFVFAVGGITAFGSESANIKLSVEQLTSGTKHHFFGYIGQCQTIPWNETGQYILGLEIDRIDRMPKPDEAATIILIDIKFF